MSASAKAQSFLEAMAKQVRKGLGQEVVCDVDAAVEFAFDVLVPEPGWPAELKAQCMPAYTRIKREILKNTVGAPCRLETPRGPLFLGAALAAWAGADSEANYSKVSPPWPHVRRERRAAA